MKMTRSAKLITGLGLMASLFWGCQDLLSQKDGSAKDPEAITTDESSLRLSIKDDSACRDQWNAILDARAGGLADTAAEKSFLADCVKEIKPGKDKLPPVIPPHLQPDSISRCHWIVAQIEGGRDEMTVSYKRYCPEDCRKLGKTDSSRHGHLCRDPHGPGVDTTKHPKPPIDSTKPPIDTIKPPENPLHDSCKVARARLAVLDSASHEAVGLRAFLSVRCGNPRIPPADTTKPKPPIDTLPKPIPVKPSPHCDEMRAKLLTLDAVSEDSKHLVESILEHCPEAKP